jgi:hypothetical protein
MLSIKNQAIAKFDIPELLKAQHNWLVWRLTQKPGQKKPSKIPYYATNGVMRSGEQGSQEDRAQLVSFEEALAAAERGGFSGVGMALLPGLDIVALDFDNCVDDTGKITVPFITDVATSTYTEYSPSGTGIRAFMRGTLPSKKDTKPLDGGFAVEVFGDSGFVTVTGNVVPECAMFGCETEVVELTEDVLALYRDRFGEVPSAGGSAGASGALDENDAFMLSVNLTLGWTLQDARGVLFDCDPGCDRDHWVKAGMALHYELGGSDEALRLYDEWSSGGANYVSFADVQGRWRSFKPSKGNGNQITGKWLVHWQGESNRRKAYAQTEKWKAEIKSTRDEYTLRECVVPKIKADPILGKLERESLAQDLRDALRSAGTKLPIGECRKMISPIRVKSDGDIPECFQDVVYVTDMDKFYCKKSGEILTVQGFNSKFNRDMPRDEHGNVVASANVLATEKYQIPTVLRVMYAPHMPEFFSDPCNYTEDAATFLNSFRPESVPVEAQEIVAGSDGAVAVDRLKFHIEQVLCGGRQDVADLLISYLAFCVQNPGVKVRWMPVIKGLEGDGKSLLLTLMANVMGINNVKPISLTEILSAFTGWGEGACFAAFEELRLQGHNRFDVHNTIKPFITNDMVNIHKKGRDGYKAINVTNYIAFTNSKDALPIGDSDRRFMVIFTKFESRVQLDSLLASRGGAAHYFSQLNDSFATHFATFRRWLLDYPMAAGFNPNSTAPITDEKQRMIAMNVSEESIAIKDVIAEGGMGITENAVVSSILRDRVNAFEGDIHMDKRTFSIEMKKLGWEQHAKTERVCGKPDRIWLRGGVTWNKELKAKLENPTGTQGFEF